MERGEALRRLHAELLGEGPSTADRQGRDGRVLALDALAHLAPARAAAYSEWLGVGMALHSVSTDLLDAWDGWSRQCPDKYMEGGCARKWQSFTAGGGIGLGSLIYWARQDGWSPGRNGAAGRRAPSSAGGHPPTPDAGGAAPAPQGRRPAAAIILDHLKAVYDPAFRRGDRVWSRTMRAEIRRGEALARAGDSTLMAALTAQALEMPRDDDGQARRGAPPKVYREWSPVAWADLLRLTPDEPVAAEVEPTAGTDFRRRLAGALTRIVTLGRAHKGSSRDRDDGPEREARSLLHWCLLFARPGGWAQVRSYFTWCRLEGNVGDPHEALRVAIRHELLGQLGLRDLEELGQDGLADLCERYDAGRRCRAGRGGQRAIELEPSYLRGLLDTPGAREGDGDGDSPTHAHARENTVTPSPEESSP
jgi:hypothetical protein